MSVKDIFDVGEKVLSVFRDAPLVILAVAAIAFLIAWRWRGAVDGGEIRELKTQLGVRDERLQLAKEGQGLVTMKAEALQTKVSMLTTQVSKHVQLSTVASTTASIAESLTDLSTANSSLGTTLSLNIGRDQPLTTRAKDRS